MRSGEKAAEAVVDAVKDGPFLSKDDFRNRTKVSKTVVDLLSDLKILDGLPESNQLSLFDFCSVIKKRKQTIYEHTELLLSG
ncbi:MAG: hypothetical protein ACLTSZ_14430 [Lachnospiraceae bacterium]